MSCVIVGLGSNLGDRLAVLRRAASEMAVLGRVTATSEVFETEPAGGPPQPAYLNAAVALETDLDPFTLLEALRAIEDRLGRVRAERWGPRVIDLDLLFYRDVKILTPRLVVPHPRLHERAFARYPAAQVGGPIEPGPPPGRSLGRLELAPTTPVPEA